MSPARKPKRVTPRDAGGCVWRGVICLGWRASGSREGRTIRPIDAITLLTGGGAILLLGIGFLNRDGPGWQQATPRVVKAAVRLVILGAAPRGIGTAFALKVTSGYLGQRYPSATRTPDSGSRRARSWSGSMAGPSRRTLRRSATRPTRPSSSTPWRKRPAASTPAAERPTKRVARRSISSSRWSASPSPRWAITGRRRCLRPWPATGPTCSEGAREAIPVSSEASATPR